MKIAVPNQARNGETRAAMDPPTLKKLVALKLEVAVESGAGQAAGHLDADYTAAGATVVAPDAFNAAWSDADAVLTLHPPTVEQIRTMKSGSLLIGMLAPLAHQEQVKAAVDQNVTMMSLEFVPRISRAQAMDVLSSQANIGGYMAVILAARASRKMFPMMITAAGTIAPSRVFILGAGVAGLQAIATAKRLGAVVEAYDVRPEVEEQVQSLGARFVKLPTTRKDAGTSGGYAREQSEEERQQQIALMKKHVTGADAVVTTAAVFGKAPPMLIPADMVQGMKPGSVVVDMAASPQHGRGNCELTRPGQQYVTDGGVIIDGTLNLPALLPVHSSQMYANNMLAFLKEIVKEGQVKLDLTDDIQKGACITHGGEVRNQLVKNAMGAGGAAA